MVLLRLLVAALVAVVLFDPQIALAQSDVKEPTATGRGGAAASVDLLGTQAAIDTLRNGGNAVDAAVAAAGVLGVTEPYSCGIGGGGFMVIRTRKGEVTTIDSRELSPRAMRPDSFMENGAPLAFNDARYSGLSAGVPGTVAGWERALDRYGTLDFRDVLRPGIETARNGFVVDRTFISQTEPNIPWFDDIPSTAQLYLDPDGSARDEGSVLSNPDLARTYQLIARRGSDGFYEGPVAEAIAAASQRPPVGPNANHTWRAGLITEDDVDDYTAPERDPARIRYRGLDVWGMGPPSSGGSTVGEALNILEGFPLSAADRPRALHLLLEASRYAFADRNAYLADPAFFDVPLSGLLSDSFAAERRALINPDLAGTSAVAPGDPYDNQGRAGHAESWIRNDLAPAPVDDPPRGLRPQGNGRLLHVHDRVHGRQRHRGPRLGLPAQQRADRLQLRLHHAPESRRGPQAPALIDGADDRDQARQAVPRGGLSRRLDHHRHRCSGAARPDRPRHLVAQCHRKSAGRAA
jgi:gamma-glutamyltranspeptidase